MSHISRQGGPGLAMSDVGTKPRYAWLRTPPALPRAHEASQHAHEASQHGHSWKHHSESPLRPLVLQPENGTSWGCMRVRHRSFRTLSRRDRANFGNDRGTEADKAALLSPCCRQGDRAAPAGEQGFKGVSVRVVADAGARALCAPRNSARVTRGDVWQQKDSSCANTRCPRKRCRSRRSTSTT